MSVVRSRLKGEMDRLALTLTSSLEHDRNIFFYDILVDLAHVLTLLKAGHISSEDAIPILKAILEVRDEGMPEGGEDVHEAIEARIIEKAGSAGMKMHTARSRNDEIATCLRLFARDSLLHLAYSLLNLREVLLNRAEEYIDAVMPGFTHLQYAQPTKLSHHLIAYHDMITRDFQRCMDAFKRINLCPLGSAAFASTPFQLDRHYTAKLLGFDGIVENSEDATASRDFLIESIFVSTSVMLTLSRIAEEIILWASEFGFVELPDEYASSSSIMPQKKNPDVAEIVRAKAGKLTGNLMAAMAIYKAMPLSYNRDFQEMNPLLYDSLQCVNLSCDVMAGMLEKVKFRTDVMEEKAGRGFSVATHIADELVKLGVPFRKAHRIVGRLSLNPSYENLKKIMEEEGLEPMDEENFKRCMDVKEVVEARKNIGGTSKEEIRQMLEDRLSALEKDADMVAGLAERISRALEELYREVEMILGGTVEKSGKVKSE
ncbi:argininosuccinate lyase [Archaeoglobus veneficus]|uniref:Argininosuccinate lyase n=1 Tax=Archaeoglobus veneficus (strain DSM 11195 / SNP6) TaxID=693661 RepID=F2KNZ7_ARCVS|nr:argininosuccinate lyase [Archaeoglobus veneficus]AEA46305.1 Argininosuccinate lyase [Archaeoglobus veneficus SNP6]